jgi:hypothetical protein
MRSPLFPFTNPSPFLIRKKKIQNSERTETGTGPTS